MSVRYDEMLFCQDCFGMFPVDEVKAIHPSADGEEAFFLCPHCNRDNLKVIKSNQYDLWCEIAWLRKKQNAMRNTMLKAVEVLNQINESYDKKELDRQHFKKQLNILIDNDTEGDYDESK